MKILAACAALALLAVVGAICVVGSPASASPKAEPAPVYMPEITSEQQQLKCELLDTDNVPNAVQTALNNWGSGC